MMKQIIISIGIVVLGCAPVNGQPCKKKYRDKLETDSRLISCGANFTIEKLKDGVCILKRYYTENKMITQMASYKSDDFNELYGLFEERWDDGTLVTSGMYVRNKKIGLWRENINQIGFYINGKREGLWKTIEKDSIISETSEYKDGDLDGQRMKYDSLGLVILTEHYEAGNLINTTADVTKNDNEEMPRFPGCEQQNLSEEDLQKCSQEKLMEYVYGNLKYPRESREQDIQGKALIQFVINQDGDIDDIKVLNGVSKDIKEEVISLVRRMPKWKPGIQDSRPVKVLYTLPVSFKLE